jgi:hypothetical protein
LNSFPTILDLEGANSKLAHDLPILPRVYGLQTFSHFFNLDVIPSASLR